MGNYSTQVDDGEHGKTRTRQKAREKIYSASSAGNCVREENILAVIWLRKGGEQIFETMNAASRGKSKEGQKWVSHLLQVMQEEIVNSDNILWSKIEFWSKNEDEIKRMLNRGTTEWSILPEKYFLFSWR